MKEHVQPEVVRKIFRRDHQSKRDSTCGVAAVSRCLFDWRDLFRAQKKVEAEQHEEDQQRVFFADAVVSDGVYAKRPESCGQQRVPTIKESGRQEKYRYDC